MSAAESRHGSAESDAYDDEWCCRRCYALALEESPLLPGEPAPVIRFREDFKTRPTTPAGGDA